MGLPKIFLPKSLLCSLFAPISTPPSTHIVFISLLMDMSGEIRMSSYLPFIHRKTEIVATLLKKDVD